MDAFKKKNRFNFNMICENLKNAGSASCKSGSFFSLLIQPIYRGFEKVFYYMLYIFTVC